MKRTLLIVIGSLDSGGTEHQLLQILPAIIEDGWDVNIYLISSRGKFAEAFEGKGVKLVGVGSLIVNKKKKFLFLRLFKMFRVFCDLVRYLVVSRPTIVHCFLPEAYLLGTTAGLLVRHKRMLMSRRSLNNYQKNYPLVNYIERYFHKRMKLIIANSEAVARNLLAENVPMDKIRVIYNGIDTRRYNSGLDRKVVRKNMKLSNENLILITVANLIKYKGHEDLIHALGQIKNNMPQNWKLLCVGRDEGIGRELQELAESLGLKSHIDWLGERGDVPELLSIADIGLLCSHQEGFSNAILEGMAAGLPMIVTDVGGNAEAVIDGVTGYVVPSNDPDKISGALHALIDDSELRNKMGCAGRSRVENKFSLQECINHYESLYEEIYK